MKSPVKRGPGIFPVTIMQRRRGFQAAEPQIQQKRGQRLSAEAEGLQLMAQGSKVAAPQTRGGGRQCGIIAIAACGWVIVMAEEVGCQVRLRLGKRNLARAQGQSGETGDRKSTRLN